MEQAVAEGGVPGMLVEIREGHQRRFGAAGVADTATGRARQPQERYRIGSTTKTFTATVILQLAAERRLGLDDTVERWLPGLVRGNGNDGRKITIRHLLSMTSGLFNYSLDPAMLTRYYSPAFMRHRFDRYTPEQLVKIAMGHAPDYAPGMDWAYSNTGYILAGMIIERVTGSSYAEQVDQRIIRPLRLTGTYVPGNETQLRGPHARHYSTHSVPQADAPVHDVTQMSASTSWAAGGMVSTTGDLTRFFQALLRGWLLPPAQQRQMFATAATPQGKWIPDTTYGLGVSSIKLPCGTTVWGMGGAINGSFSFTYGTRDGRHMMAQNVNGDWNNPIDTFTKALDAEFCTKA
ncbi:serine hydrolase domain-containing protein [Actinomadura namibiensis]